MLKVKDLSKKYEKVLAVNKVSFEIDSGEIGVLIGPNGAGKSTTIKSIAGLLRFEGEITIDGKPNKSIEAKRIFGYVPESPSLYDSLSVWDHLEFVARAYKLQDWTDTAEELLARFTWMIKRKRLEKTCQKACNRRLVYVVPF